MTCNGQAPFVTMFMYLDEVPEGQTRNDLAKIIREVLKQRIKGVKNEKGVWITPAFPKIIYVLDEDNVTPDSPFYDLTVQNQLLKTCPNYLTDGLAHRRREVVTKR